MKLFVLDKEKLTKFTLPKKISGAYAFNYTPPNSKVIRTLNIEVKDNNWYIKNTESITIVNLETGSTDGMIADKTILQLRITDLEENISIYCTDTTEENLERYVTSQTAITAGNAASNAITYNNQFILPTSLAIVKKEDNHWYVDAPKSDVVYAYLNGKRIESSRIHPGDVIFLYGLKIVWMESFIQVNNPSEKVEINSAMLMEYTQEQNTQEEIQPVSDEDMAKELYTEKDYFFHTPRLKQSIEDEEITIDAPPQSQIAEELPIIFTIGTQLTMIASSAYTGYNAIISLTKKDGDKIQAIFSLVLFITMLIGTIILPTILKKYQKKLQQTNELKRVNKYTKYLEEKEKEIKNKLVKQKSILETNHPNILEINNRIMMNNNNSLIWQREINDEDYLKIRLGKGNIPSKLKINSIQEHFKLEEDALENKLKETTKNLDKLEDVPITFSFLEKYISAIICNINDKDEYINSILLQLMYYHSAKDLKLVFLLDENSNINIDYMKFAPHCISDDKSTRYFASNQEEIKKISGILGKELETRKDTKNKDDKKEEENVNNKTYAKHQPFYLIIANNYSSIKNIKLINDILKCKSSDYGFAITFIEKSLQSLPNECTSFIELYNEECCILENNLNNQTKFLPEYLVNLDMRKIVNKMANIPLEIANQSLSLPNSISFLEMFNVAKIDHLNIENRWKTNDPTVSLKTLIGVHSNGDDFILDLHEKAHGPHGLIAGSTGSGKSEFIITYLLSLAVNYHPDEVQFVLIDYKGGGLAGAFENRETGIKIPHVVGTITNLDTSEMNRSLVSINSEIKRRQVMFNKAKTLTGESTIDIYKYQHYYREGILKEPIAHLFIVSDEFAELKSQQPEFMTELISAARIGRSLGIHLILATQKPSGVVNDQIWSNSKFKVCLKVQDRGDSMEVLKKPDAASIKEAGRFYLQVGYDELFDIGQSGWAGAKYIPSDTIKKKTDNSIKMINNIGETLKEIQETKIVNENEKSNGDQLTNIVKHLYNWTNENNYKIKKLWLDNIPEIIYLSNLKEKYNYKEPEYTIRPIIGEYDNPSQQMQGLLSMDITDKNTLIYGTANSGKETLLSTLIFSLITNHTTDDINLYIMDFGAETLKQYQKTPQVGEVCTLSDEDKIFNTFLMIDKELERRKELFIEYGGNYKEYCRTTKEKLPLIHIIINNYEVFSENMNKITELLKPIYRESSKYGVTFTIATGAANSFSSRTAEYFQNVICMQMPNNDDYRSVLGCERGLIPANYPARGICNIDDIKCEFQTAYINEKDKISETIRETNKKLLELNIKKAPRTPIIPNIVKIDDVIGELKDATCIPIGFNMEEKMPITYDFANNKNNLIIHNNCKDIKEFIYSFTTIIKNINNNNLSFIDFDNELNENNIQCKYIKNNYLEEINNIKNELSKGKQQIVIINSISKARNALKDNLEAYTALIKLFVTKGIITIIINPYEEFKSFKIESFYNQIFNTNKGIWLGNGLGDQIIFDTSTYDQDLLYLEYDNMGYIINEDKLNLVKFVTNKEENDE